MHRYLLRSNVYKLFNERVFTMQDIQPSEHVKRALNLTNQSFMELYSFLLYLSTLCNYLTISSHCSFLRFVAFNKPSQNVKNNEKKQTAVPDQMQLAPSKLSMTTVFTT